MDEGELTGDGSCVSSDSKQGGTNSNFDMDPGYSPLI